LIKPVRGASGRGIKTWRGSASSTLRETHFYQKRIEGLPCSAVFVATHDRTYLVGLSRQRIGDPAFNAASFAYCGSSGPIFFDAAITRQIEKTGDVVARRARLRGLFGIDLVFDGTAAVPIEINPRYTASVEIFEQAYPVALLDWHRRACVTYADPGGSTAVDQFLDAQIQAIGDTSRPPKFVEKAILFADRPIVTPSLEHLAFRRSAGLITLVADRPRVGTPIEAGRPICSLLVIGPDEDACRQHFDSDVVALKQALVDRSA
ncbi:MAG: ATP-grasp domain-containing protein, partial [Planctomycetaceae bacterium]